MLLVVAITEEGAAAHINKLSHKYRDQDYVIAPGDTRATSSRWSIVCR